jgi:retron-type reverse transcriptase
MVEDLRNLTHYTPAPLRRVYIPKPGKKEKVRGWLKAGIVDHGETIFPEAGTAQDGPLSSLLANVVLHGLETALRQAVPANKCMDTCSCKLSGYCDRKAG